MPPSLIYSAFSLNLIYQFFTHTERIGKLPRPVEFVFNTPSHHRVHHGSDVIYLDRNYGGILIVWDRLFGTFQPELHRPTYGLTKPVGTYNVVRLQFHEYAAILRDLRDAHSGPAGWDTSRSPGLAATDSRCRRPGGASGRRALGRSMTVVTGVARGIGALAAMRLAARNAQVGGVPLLTANCMMIPGDSRE